jgi:hypothetical protein
MEMATMKTRDVTGSCPSIETKEKWSTFHPSNRDNNKTPHKLPQQNVTQFLKAGQILF